MSGRLPSYPGSWRAAAGLGANSESGSALAHTTGSGRQLSFVSRGASMLGSSSGHALGSARNGSSHQPGPSSVQLRQISHGQNPSSNRKIQSDMNVEARLSELVNSRSDVMIAWKQTEELQKRGQALWYFKRFYEQWSKYLLPKNDGHGQFEPTIRMPVFDGYTRPDGTNFINLTVFLPEEAQFKAASPKRRDAENEAALEAIFWLRNKNLLSFDLKPIFESKEEIQKLSKGITPVHTIPIQISLLNRLKAYIEHFRSEVKPQLESAYDPRSPTLLASPTYQSFDQQDFPGIKEKVKFDAAMAPPEAEDGGIFNVISGHRYRPPDERDRVKRNRQLRELMAQRDSNPRLKHYRQSMINQLPISMNRDQILDTIATHQVTVICGETGSGKTTQVPQMILEQAAIDEQAHQTSILVTQPRRLPAISVAEQVAFQFGEQDCGGSIGYQVRFDKRPPTHDYGSILFCTTGILLRKMQDNPQLLGCSHIIIDEVHERDVTTDLLLILLKRLIRKNRSLRLILMSASINAQQFSKYFDEAPILQFSGRCYDVDIKYLEQIKQKMLTIRKDIEIAEQFISYSMQPRIHYQLIAQIIHAIDYSHRDDKGAGSILVFLPGWEEIKSARDAIQSLSYHHNLKTILLHSNIPHSEQREIFEPPQPGTRKVILSTNIAETSVTVPDVVFVIDSGLCKEIRYCKQSDVSTFGTYFVSKANALQRSGRAGRVKPGICYRLYPESFYKTKFDQFPEPEMLRIPLENVTMLAKLYCPKEKVEQVLDEALDPPDRSVLSAALGALKVINILTPDEHLTVLGERIVHFTLHPRLSLALVMSAMLGVLDPVLNVAAALTAPRNLFVGGMDDRKINRDIKDRFDRNGYKSDHIALSEIIREFEEQGGISWKERVFCEDNHLHFGCMKNVLELKDIYRKHLLEAGILTEQQLDDGPNGANRNRDKLSLALSALLAGFYPNLVLRRRGIVKGNKIQDDKYWMADMRTGHPAKVGSESIARDSRSREERGAQSLVTYFSAFYSQQASQLTLKDASLITPLNFLIFCGKKVDLIHKEPEISQILIDDFDFLRFDIGNYDLNVVVQWKDLLVHFSNWFITRSEQPSMLDEKVELELKQYLNLTSELLEMERRMDAQY